ncbi:MAG: hypothetical protein R3A46_11365 [Thermomicrobiales bacterium]
MVAPVATLESLTSFRASNVEFEIDMPHVEESAFTVSEDPAHHTSSTALYDSEVLPWPDEALQFNSGDDMILKELKQRVEKYPNDPDTLVALASEYINQRRYLDARQYLERVLLDCPNHYLYYQSTYASHFELKNTNWLNR